MHRRSSARADARAQQGVGASLARVAASLLALAGVVTVLFSVKASAAHAVAVGERSPVRLVNVLDGRYAGLPTRVSRALSASRTYGIAAATEDAINVAYDVRRSRVLVLDRAGRLADDGAVAGALRLQVLDAQGMTVDPESGVVFVLDAGASRILRVTPRGGGDLASATVSAIDVDGLSGARGIAFDRSTGHLHVRHGRSLVEIASGERVATRALSAIALASPAGMVFAPTGDRTDDPSQLSLYVADSGGIVELSIAPLVAAPQTHFTSTLLRTVDLGALVPASSDPSGITYLPAPADKLVITDGEIEETVNGIEHFEGANVWELTRTGSVLRTANVSSVPPTAVPMTNEPAGIAFNPVNGHYYVSADDGKKVYDVNPGMDGLLGTAGDTWTSFSTLAGGNDNVDPEGITYDTFNGRLYVADGVNREVYEYETDGTLVGHFDVLGFGVIDPESVEFNPVSGTLFVLGQDSLIVETTTTGTLVDTIDVSASGGLKHSGLAYGPRSDGSGGKSFYVVDRGIDNNVDPDAVDGKLFELSAPTPGVPANSPPVVEAGLDQETTLPASASLDGDVTDDGEPIPPGAVTTTWTMVSGPSSVTFGDASAVETSASVSVPGIYVVRLTASDGQYSAFDETTLTFSGAGGSQSLDVRVNVNSDDAEEVAGTGVVQRGDNDLDMMTDTSDTKLVVGTRFTGVSVPAGASITTAYLQFQADEAHSVPTTLAIKAQAADNAPTFSTTAYDLSSRPTTAASASWSPDPWLAVGDAGLAQRSSDLAGVVQEIVSRPGWASGNSLVLLTTGVGRRVAVARNLNPAAAPLLHVEWATGSGNSPPQITSGGGGATASALPAEGQTYVTHVEASDPDPDPDTLTYSISGGADASAFAIDSVTGVLTFVTVPDFETPTDAGANNVYDVVVTVSDGNGGSDSQAMAATLQNVNEFSPVVTSDGGGSTASLSRPDDQTGVTDVNASDGDGQPLAYSISGGDDQAAFVIDAVSGVLSFVTPPDFDAPTDVGANNVYEVVVSASDDSFADTQEISVTVTANGGSPLYFTLLDLATVGGVAADNEDVVFFDGAVFSLAFDGSDVGLATFRIDGFAWLSPTSLLLSFDASGAVPGISGTVDDSDVVRFTATSLGTTTAGTFTLYFDGSDVGLSTSGEDVDAVELLPNGRILFSTINTASVTGVSVEDEDLLEFVPTSLGPTTAGSFSQYFDGSDVGLTLAGEDVDGAAVGASGKLYLSTFNSFSAPGVSGQDDDVFAFTPSSLGTDTAGTYSSPVYFDGAPFGLAANDVSDIDLS